MDCRTQSPQADNDYALIDGAIGWRLTRSKAADGSVVREWRCPSCWAEHKRTRTEVSTAVSPPIPKRQSIKPPAKPSSPPSSRGRRSR